MRITASAALAAAVVALGPACASRSRAPAPAAAPAPARTVLPGKFVWHDLVTESPEACRRFYGTLLGWQFEDIQRLGKPYAIAKLGGQRVAGLVSIAPSAEK